MVPFSGSGLFSLATGISFCFTTSSQIIWPDSYGSILERYGTIKVIVITSHQLYVAGFMVKFRLPFWFAIVAREVHLALQMGIWLNCVNLA